MSERNPSSWLPNLLGPLDLQVDGVDADVPRRSTINLIGAAIADDPANERTDITLGAGGGVALPEGNAGDVTVLGATPGTLDNGKRLGVEGVAAVYLGGLGSPFAHTVTEAEVAESRAFIFEEAPSGTTVIFPTPASAARYYERVVSNADGAEIQVGTTGSTLALPTGRTYVLGFHSDGNVTLVASHTAPGGGTTPTGTGLRKVVSGVENAAASLLVNADVAAAAAIAVTKLANPGAGTWVLKSIAGVIQWVAEAFDPASLVLSGYYRNFGGGTWSGTASAGTSGARSLNSNTDVTAGTLDGIGIALFNGSSSWLTNTSTTLDNYLSDSEYAVSLLVKPKAPSAPAGAVYDNECLVGETGANWGIAWSTSGVNLFHYDGVAWRETGWVACSADSWHQIDARYDGTNIRIRVDKGAWSTPVAAASLAGIGGLVFRVGRNFGSAYAEMDLAQIATSFMAMSDTDLDNIYASRQAAYPSAGLP